MKKVAEEKKVVVAQAKTEAEELLVEIVQDKRVADEQEKQVGDDADVGGFMDQGGEFWCCINAGKAGGGGD
jgi:hypothetical protein